MRQWVSLLNSLMYLASTFSRAMIKAALTPTEVDEPLLKCANWHLFKGGLRLPELEASPAELVDLGLKQ